MNVSVMSNEFNKWLDECPVQWDRINDGKIYHRNGLYYEGATYMFLKDYEENEENEE